MIDPMSKNAAKGDVKTGASREATPDATPNAIASLRADLLADMQAMQAALPMDAEDVSEAIERRARIISMMARSLEIMARLSQKRSSDGDDKISNRETLLATIEQRLARLAQAENPQAYAGDA